MRIYLPATAVDLDEPDGVGARRAHALTPALLAAIGDDDAETGEFAAMLIAADESIDRIGAAGAVPLRVVIAADVPDAQVRAPEQEAPPSGVDVDDVPWRAVVSFHVDGPDDKQIRDLVGRAVAGDEAALAATGDADLLWYDVTEREQLREQLRG
ncbi:hypothetical protein EXU48_07540 [Occultella glacieicola]|uniref:Uncharacterized protein n=1 Tax=Occultella glacieicola TaxID=2518684 RepID=A0ABY2E661_9MICO|nr:hypothetical protein [Occultella glacieicola]TDE96080.1 hypothetical protein EXU48_07540 [Occultella glacieicola]